MKGCARTTAVGGTRPPHFRQPCTVFTPLVSSERCTNANFVAAFSLQPGVSLRSSASLAASSEALQRPGCSVQAFVLLGAAAAICAQVIPHISQPGVASTQSGTTNPAAWPPQWLPEPVVAGTSPSTSTLPSPSSPLPCLDQVDNCKGPGGRVVGGARGRGAYLRGKKPLSPIKQRLGREGWSGNGEKGLLPENVPQFPPPVASLGTPVRQPRHGNSIDRNMSAKPNGYWRVAATNTTDEKPARIAMIGAAW